MSFISDQASFGQPAEYSARNQELEGEYRAFKDLLPKKAHVFADQIGRISGEYLTPDQPYYKQFKDELKNKAEEFQKRLSSGEDIGSITNEMSNYRNQVSGALDAFKKRKDMFESWNSALEKNDKIPSNVKTDLRNLALDNISKITSKKGLTLDLPLPSPAVPVNYDERGAKLVDEMVEKEGQETYGSKWHEISVDPTKFANFKTGFVQRNKDKIKQAVLSGLANDPEVQSSLDQDAELHLHKTFKNTDNPIEKEYIAQNAGELHDQIKQAKLHDVSDLLSWTKQGLQRNQERTIIDNTEKKAAAEKEKTNPNVPVYESPQTPIKGIDTGDDFKIKDKGTQIALTEEERQNIARTGALGNYPILGLKKSKEERYSQPREMKEESKNFLLGISKYIDPKIEAKIKSGKDLTKKEQELLYPQADKIAEEAKKDIEVNSRVIGLTEKESDDINRQLFGKEKDQTVKNLGTGLAVNTKIWDKSKGKLVTLDDIQEEHDGEARVSIQGRFTGENAYVIATGGDKSFAAPKQLSIGNKEYIISGPEAYINTKTGDYSNPDNEKLKKDQELNEIYNAKLTKLPLEVNTNSGEKMTIYYNNKEGKYISTYKGVPIESSSAENIQRYINEH